MRNPAAVLSHLPLHIASLFYLDLHLLYLPSSVFPTASSVAEGLDLEGFACCTALSSRDFVLLNFFGCQGLHKLYCGTLRDYCRLPFHLNLLQLTDGAAPNPTRILYTYLCGLVGHVE